MQKWKSREKDVAITMAGRGFIDWTSRCRRRTHGGRHLQVRPKYLHRMGVNEVPRGCCSLSSRRRRAGTSVHTPSIAMDRVMTIVCRLTPPDVHSDDDACRSIGKNVCYGGLRRCRRPRPCSQSCNRSRPRGTSNEGKISEQAPRAR